MPDESMRDEARVGFIGTGKMAQALARGLLASGWVAADRIVGYDPVPEACRAFAAVVGEGRTLNDAPEVADKADVIVLAVKSDKVREALLALAAKLTDSHLLLSIAAGVSLEVLERDLNVGIRVIRVMPNAPAMVGAGAAGYALGSYAKESDALLAEKLLNAVGIATKVPESLLDAVTGLSGSGPAFVFQMIEAMADGGVASGLPREVANRLAAQTVLGSAKMVLEGGQHTACLKDVVASPGGTTIDGIHELEKGAFRGTIMSAVRAASEKSRKLGKRSGGSRRKRSIYSALSQ